MPAALVPIAGAVAGSVVSGALNKGGGGGSSQTTTNEPWSAVQPWMKENIEKGQKLQGYYEQNPFNQLQQTSYQNMFGDIENYRQNMAPSMMALSNRLMNSNYQRAPAGSEMGGYLQPPQGRSMGTYRSGEMMGNSAAGGQPGQSGDLGGLLGQYAQGAAPLAMGGLLSGGGISGALGGLMSSQGQDMTQGGGQGMQSGGIRPSPLIPTMMANPGTAYGQIDFDALNPYKNALKPEEKPADTGNTTGLNDDELEYLRRQYAQDKFRRDQYGDFGGGGA